MYATKSNTHAKRENHIKSFRKSFAIGRSRQNVFVWHMTKLTMKLFSLRDLLLMLRIHVIIEF